jgi:hypothetical protein
MFRISKTTALGLIAACAIVCGVSRSTYASEAASSAPDPIVFNISITIPVGSGYASSAVGPVPAGKYMVVQTVSYYRDGVVAGSIGQLGIISKLNGKLGVFYTLPCPADGSPFPATTLSAVFYAGPGKTMTAAAYRSGDESASEMDVVTVSGYLVNGPPNG